MAVQLPLRERTVPDNRPIGIFDSGVGGLTVLLAMQDSLPNESTIYLGDLARCPYGPRPQTEVRGFAIEVGDLLAEQDIKLLVIACNTATAAAYDELRRRYGFPVVGVIAPGAAEAVRRSENGRIAVVATDGTIASAAYSAAIRECDPAAFVVERPASWLVPLIEYGTESEAEIAQRLVPLCADLRRQEVDTLILGCTHFPLVRALFETEMGSEVTVLDSATTTTREVAHLLSEFGIEGDGFPFHRFLVTGPSEAFAARAQTMFRASPPIETVGWSPRPLNSL